MARSKEGTYMFSGFLEFFKKPVQYNIYGNDYRTFVIGFGGIQFGRGLFTVLDKANALVLEKKLGYAFPEYKGSFRLFGFDWMGRCFAVPSDNEDKVIVFDPGVFEAYDVSLGFRDFVNKAIPMSTNECLSSDAFISWYKATGETPAEGSCIGYKIPLFLGGADAIDNFETVNMEEYWDIITKAGRKLRGLEDEELKAEEAPEEEPAAEALSDDEDLAGVVVAEGELPEELEGEAAEEAAEEIPEETAEETSDKIPEESEVNMWYETPGGLQDIDDDDEMLPAGAEDRAFAGELSEDEFFARQADEAEEFFRLQKKRAPYIQKNVEKYLGKFKKMHDNDTKLSWNWCGFLFMEIWLGYRKMYKPMILMILLQLVANVALAVAITMISIKQGIEPYGNMTWAVLIGFAPMLVFMLISGIFGNSWYRKKIDRLVREGEAAGTHEERERILGKGGVNIPIAIVLIVLSILYMLPNILFL